MGVEAPPDAAPCFVRWVNGVRRASPLASEGAARGSLVRGCREFEMRDARGLGVADMTGGSVPYGLCVFWNVRVDRKRFLMPNP